MVPHRDTGSPVPTSEDLAELDKIEHNNVEVNETAENDDEDDDESTCVDAEEVESKLKEMKKMILTTRKNLKALESVYTDLAALLGGDCDLSDDC